MKSYQEIHENLIDTRELAKETYHHLSHLYQHIENALIGNLLFEKRNEIIDRTKISEKSMMMLRTDLDSMMKYINSFIKSMLETLYQLQEISKDKIDVISNNLDGEIVKDLSEKEKFFVYFTFKDELNEGIRFDEANPTISINRDTEAVNASLFHILKEKLPIFINQLDKIYTHTNAAIDIKSFTEDTTIYEALRILRSDESIYVDLDAWKCGGLPTMEILGSKIEEINKLTGLCNGYSNLLIAIGGTCESFVKSYAKLIEKRIEI